MGPKMLPNSVLAALLGIFGVVSAGRILAILPSPSPSHQVWNRALVEALSSRGHEMTVLSPVNEVGQDSKKREIHMEDTQKMVNMEFLNEELAEKNYVGILTELWKRSIQLCDHQLHTKGARELLEMPSNSFDLIIIETILNDCFNLYLHHFGGGTKIPVVGLTAIGTGPWTDKITGNKALPSVNPMPFLPYSTQMTIWQRFHNALLTFVASVGMSIYYLPRHQKIAEEVYGMPLPPLSELSRNISIVLANNHYSINGPQQNIPGVIDVAGMHCVPAKTLPLNLVKFVNGAEKGIIYLSFGSALHSHNLPKDKLQSIIYALAALGPKIRVLWKYESSTPLEGIPSNVLIQKWLPQQDILGHPKTLMFVSHGGLLSVQESIFHAIPIVGIPFTGYQDRNVKSLVSSGVAVHLDFGSLTKNTLVEAIHAIIRDTSYRRKMHKLSSIFRDQPENPLDRAIFWTEHSFRHGGGRVEHIRSATVDISWFAYYMVDILFILILFSLVIIIAILNAFHYVRGKHNMKDKSTMKFKPSNKKKK